MLKYIKPYLFYNVFSLLNCVSIKCFINNQMFLKQCLYSISVESSVVRIWNYAKLPKKVRTTINEFQTKVWKSPKRVRLTPVKGNLSCPNADHARINVLLTISNFLLLEFFFLSLKSLLLLQLNKFFKLLNLILYDIYNKVSEFLDVFIY